MAGPFKMRGFSPFTKHKPGHEEAPKNISRAKRKCEMNKNKRWNEELKKCETIPIVGTPVGPL